AAGGGCRTDQNADDTGEPHAAFWQWHRGRQGRVIFGIRCHLYYRGRATRRRWRIPDLSVVFVASDIVQGNHDIGRASAAKVMVYVASCRLLFRVGAFTACLCAQVPAKVCVYSVSARVQAHEQAWYTVAGELRCRAVFTMRLRAQQNEKSR